MDELRLGIVAMFSNVVITMFWMAYVDPLMWTYKYFDKHEYANLSNENKNIYTIHFRYNIWWFLTSIPAYLFFFDTWFYITHRWLHESQWAWDQVCNLVKNSFVTMHRFARLGAPHPSWFQTPIGICTSIKLL